LYNQETSDFQINRACDRLRIYTRPAVECALFVKRAHLCRPMRIHRPLDDLWNRREANTSFQKSFHCDFIRGVQHNREAVLSRKRAVREPETWKGLGIRSLELEMA